jgi:hypothetical protein
MSSELICQKENFVNSVTTLTAGGDVDDDNDDPSDNYISSVVFSVGVRTPGINFTITAIEATGNVGGAGLSAKGGDQGGTGVVATSGADFDGQMTMGVGLLGIGQTNPNSVDSATGVRGESGTTIPSFLGQGDLDCFGALNPIPGGVVGRSFGNPGVVGSSAASDGVNGGSCRHFGVFGHGPVGACGHADAGAFFADEFAKTHATRMGCSGPRKPSSTR